MKRQDDLGVGGSIFMTVGFAAAAIFTYQTDPSGNPLAWIPGEQGEQNRDTLRQDVAPPRRGTRCHRGRALL